MGSGPILTDLSSDRKVDPKNSVKNLPSPRNSVTSNLLYTVKNNEHNITTV